MRIFRQYKLYKDKMKDIAMQRELVGIDKYGNKYYQYYSFYGLPHRREYCQRQRLNLFEDLAFYFWLRKQEQLPPTAEYLEIYYLEEQKRRRLGLEWDLKEQQLSLDYQKQKLQLNEFKEDQQEIQAWKPKSKRKTNL